ncbi:Zinc finger, SWIM-type [Sesbania bispinosa]|nr:Zinc finger, SWIM-type [Sesbania bispinosa]
MGGHKPVVIITDQGPAMKIAIENVFTESPDEFELTWKTIIIDFKLEENGWLSQMYDMRNNDTLHTIPELKLHKDIEKHGREVYTHENFYIFQGELWSACVDCGVEETKEDNGHLLIVILEQLMVNGNKVSKHRKVVYNPSNHIAH